MGKHYDKAIALNIQDEDLSPEEIAQLTYNMADAIRILEDNLMIFGDMPKEDSLGHITEEWPVMVDVGGAWLTLARSDLFGQVESTIDLFNYDDLEALRDHLCEECLYGAIVRDGRFIVIDSATDG